MWSVFRQYFHPLVVELLLDLDDMIDRSIQHLSPSLTLPTMRYAALVVLGALDDVPSPWFLESLEIDYANAARELERMLYTSRYIEYL